MKVVLVRHTNINVAKGICYGQSDILPAATFKEEAAITLDKITECFPDKIYTSPLKRCTMLAGFCGFTNAFQDDRLMEMNFGDWEMKNWNTIHGEYATKWMENYLTLPAPNGECMHDLIDRIKDFLNEKKNEGCEQILCFTHSGPIRVAEHLINKVPIDKLFDLKIDFGGVYEYELK